MTFTYKRTITGDATGNQVAVHEDNAESYNGKLTCVPASGAPAGVEFACKGTAEARYSSKGSCVSKGKTNSHTEEAAPWQGAVEGALSFDLQATPQPNWSFTLDAPPMKIHIVDVGFDGKRSEDDAEFQVIPDVQASGTVSADGRTGVWEEKGENIDELSFGECNTGVKVETEKGDARVEIMKH